MYIFVCQRCSELFLIHTLTQTAAFCQYFNLHAVNVLHFFLIFIEICIYIFFVFGYSFHIWCIYKYILSLSFVHIIITVNNAFIDLCAYCMRAYCGEFYFKTFPSASFTFLLYKIIIIMIIMIIIIIIYMIFSSFLLIVIFYSVIDHFST